MESGTRKLQSNPRNNANWFSILFFGWTIPIFKQTYGKILDSCDVCEPLKCDQSKVLGDRLERFAINVNKINLFWMKKFHVKIFCGIENGWKNVKIRKNRRCDWLLWKHFGSSTCWLEYLILYLISLHHWRCPFYWRIFWNIFGKSTHSFSNDF